MSEDLFVPVKLNNVEDIMAKASTQFTDWTKVFEDLTTVMEKCKYVARTSEWPFERQCSANAERNGYCGYHDAMTADPFGKWSDYKGPWYPNQR